MKFSIKIFLLKKSLIEFFIFCVVLVNVVSQFNVFCVVLVNCGESVSYHWSPSVPPENKTTGFLMFSGGTEIGKWHKMS